MKNIKCIEKKGRSLALSLVFFVFGVMFAAIILAGSLTIILDAAGVIEFWDSERLENISIRPFRVIFNILAFSVFIGMAITAFFGKKALKPIRNLITATRKISKGDFNVQVDENERISEIKELACNFNLMVRELSSIETFRNDFIVSVSHEFKTPIAAIEGYATLLQDESITQSERNEYTQMIIESSRRISTLTGNILNLSKLENQEVILEKTKFRLDETLRNAVLILEPQWSDKELDLQIDLPKTNYIGNESLLSQVWLNLIGNAVKFTSHGGIIDIRLYTESSNIIVEVSDTGCGMDESMQKRIFDKFYQGDTARKSDGNGLGLALVKRIVDLCGGKITVKSECGKGSVFTVFLPSS